MRTLSVMTCVRSVESGTGSGPMPAMKMLNVDRTEGNIGVHSPLFITPPRPREGKAQWSQRRETEGKMEERRMDKKMMVY